MGWDKWGEYERRLERNRGGIRGTGRTREERRGEVEEEAKERRGQG